MPCRFKVVGKVLQNLTAFAARKRWHYCHTKVLICRKKTAEISTKTCFLMVNLRFFATLHRSIGGRKVRSSRSPSLVAARTEPLPSSTIFPALGKWSPPRLHHAAHHTQAEGQGRGFGKNLQKTQKGTDPAFAFRGENGRAGSVKRCRKGFGRK